MDGRNLGDGFEISGFKTFLLKPILTKISAKLMNATNIWLVYNTLRLDQTSGR